MYNFILHGTFCEADFKCNVEELLQFFVSISSSVQFTAEVYLEERIIFLDCSLPSQDISFNKVTPSEIKLTRIAL